MKKKTIAAAMLLACGLVAAQAQTVYRCGNEYSQKPCAGGSAVNVDDKRSAAQARDTTAAAKRDAKLGDEMQKERIAREKEVAGPSSVVLGTPKAAASAPQAAASKPQHNAKKKKTAKEPEHFTATAPKPAADKKKPAKKTSG
jgi:hypothetical protein